MMVDAAGGLRERLDGMRRQLCAVEQRVAVEAVKRKGSFDGELQNLAACITEVQEALTAEVKARVASAHCLSKDAETFLTQQRKEMNEEEKTAEQICARILSEAEEDVQAFEARVDLLVRGLTGEEEGSEISANKEETSLLTRGRLLASQTTETARKLDVVNQGADSFESQQLTDALAAIDAEHRRLLQRIRHVKTSALQWLQDGLPDYEKDIAAVRSELAALEKNTRESLNEFESYILAELELFANAIQHEAAMREETDDHLVTVLNEWNGALQKGFATIARS